MMIFILTGCSLHRASAPAAYVPNAPPIVQLKSADHLIIIHAGAQNPLYTVRTNSGKVLIREGTEQELQAQLPKVYKKISDVIAGVLWTGE